MSINKQIMRVFEENDHKATLIFEMVVDQAGRFFEECPEDFGIQYISGTSVVFGGTNRLIWKADLGFFPDRQYCSKKFLEHYAKIQLEKVDSATR